MSVDVQFTLDVFGQFDFPPRFLVWNNCCFSFRSFPRGPAFPHLLDTWHSVARPLPPFPPSFPSCPSILPFPFPPSTNSSSPLTLFPPSRRSIAWWGWFCRDRAFPFPLLRPFPSLLPTCLPFHSSLPFPPPSIPSSSFMAFRSPPPEKFRLIKHCAPPPLSFASLSSFLPVLPFNSTLLPNLPSPSPFPEQFRLMGGGFVGTFPSPLSLPCLPSPGLGGQL